MSKTTSKPVSKISTKPEIYLDYAASTPVDQRVLEAMLPYLTEEYGNAESIHKRGKNALIAVDNSRETIANILNCKTSEIIFTSGGTESNNFALIGTAEANKDKGKHIIISDIEHSSVTQTAKNLEGEGTARARSEANNLALPVESRSELFKKGGFTTTTLPVDHQGFVNPADLEKAIRPDTILVSIIYANNEIGTIQAISALGEICRKKRVAFHTDACQAANSENLDVEALNVDLMTLNSGKIYGPKGVGALYIKQGQKIAPIIFGGSHENSLRAGTHNVPGIVGLAKALELSQKEKFTESKRLTGLRDHLINSILEKIPGTHLNGPRENRLPNNINFSFEGVYGMDLTLQLDEAGIYVSTGSACKVRNPKPSSVLRAIGLNPELIFNTIRISIGKKTTEEDIDYTITTLINLVTQLRQHKARARPERVGERGSGSAGPGDAEPINK